MVCGAAAHPAWDRQITCVSCPEMPGVYTVNPASPGLIQAPASGKGQQQNQCHPGWRTATSQGREEEAEEVRVFETCPWAADRQTGTKESARRSWATPPHQTALRNANSGREALSIPGCGTQSITLQALLLGPGGCPGRGGGQTEVWGTDAHEYTHPLPYTDVAHGPTGGFPRCRCIGTGHTTL